MINPTLKQVQDIGIAVGLEPDKAEEWYYHYKAQGWKFGNGLEIFDIKSALHRWKRNQYKFEKNKKGEKIKLYPIKGKLCSHRDCKMPAVYQCYKGGDYPHYDCADHMPEEVKERYVG